MEQEAEPEGGPIANKYGDMLNKIDSAIAKLSETSDPQDGKAAPYRSGYKPTNMKITKEDVRNLVVGLLHEMKGEELYEKKDDRCTRIAKRKYDTWPSAYASGAVVRCRRGEIWKGVK